MCRIILRQNNSVSDLRGFQETYWRLSNEGQKDHGTMKNVWDTVTGTKTSLLKHGSILEQWKFETFDID
jgi:hypothetical protein